MKILPGIRLLVAAVRADCLRHISWCDYSIKETHKNRPSSHTSPPTVSRFCAIRLVWKRLLVLSVGFFGAPNSISSVLPPVNVTRICVRNGQRPPTAWLTRDPRSRPLVQFTHWDIPLVDKSDGNVQPLSRRVPALEPDFARPRVLSAYTVCRCFPAREGRPPPRPLEKNACSPVSLQKDRN